MDAAIEESGFAPTLNGSERVADVFESVYSTLRRVYRCEYVFKNAIATKVLLGRHSLRSAMLVPELRVGEAKADLVVVNGTSTAYEIKTGLDNLDRLDHQVSAYQKAFDRVCVVTELGCANRISSAIPEDVGVLALTNRYTLYVVREPKSNLDRLEPDVIFDLLRHEEYTKILRDELGVLANFPSGIRYEECKRMFCHIPVRRLHAAVVGAIRRRATAELAAFVSVLPHSLKVAGLGARLTATRRARLTETLTQPYSRQ
jgi:hypothetical protein